MMWRYQVHVQHISEFEKIYIQQLCHMPPERMGESQVSQKKLPILSMQGPTSRKQVTYHLVPTKVATATMPPPFADVSWVQQRDRFWAQKKTTSYMMRCFHFFCGGPTF